MLASQKGAALTRVLEKSGIDVLLIDLQDVGVRFYTYMWSMYDCLVAAAGARGGIKVLVLDRPNPLGGVVQDGPLLEPEFATFVGRKVGHCHGMRLRGTIHYICTQSIPMMYTISARSPSR